MLRLVQTAVVAAALVLSTSGLASAEHGSISGTVTDAKTGKPVAGVCVQLNGPYCFAYTDASGFYSISGLSMADTYYDVWFSKKSYNFAFTNVYVNGPTTLNIALKKGAK